jgi:hypothetical protein
MVECIVKGKAKRRYESGVRATIEFPQYICSLMRKGDYFRSHGRELATSDVLGQQVVAPDIS